MKKAIILAAGDGKRMNSSKPKVLAEVLFDPMIVWVLDSAVNFGCEEIGVIIGNGSDIVKSRLSEYKNVSYYVQTERKGTGHAVMQAQSMLKKGDDVLVLCGDAPFMDSDTINKAYEYHKSNVNSVTVITAEVSESYGYGRIIRDNTLSIIEEKDCTHEQRNIKEINSGSYWFDAEKLCELLPLLDSDNKNKEYYLTDTVKLASERGYKVGAYKSENADVVLGANDRRGLRKLNDIAIKMMINKHLDGGVDIIGDNIIIGRNVKIGKDTQLLPNTMLLGNTIIGENVILDAVKATDTIVENNVKIGPFVQLRPGTLIRSGVKIGDFVEIKNSEIGENTAIAHLTYIGDSDVGNKCNFGCGCVTANYDGLNKYRTKIGNNCFVGCNTNLIAPVELGDNVTTAAGSTITKNVPKGSLAIERGKVLIKDDYYNKKYTVEKT